jgi:hypothetical protein
MIRFLTTYASLLFVTAVMAAEPKPTVSVVLWFDTEDYILPASDDAALKVADWLTAEGIKATFKIVGEKARTLEKRDRQDVIASLKKHEIGYHSNYHSVQPTPAMYLSPLGWDEGVAEFDRREKPGYDDVKRIFGQAPTCYGQPGSSWGPQVYGAMRKWKMPMYLDSGSHISLDRKPLYYGGIFTVYHHEHTLRTDLGGEKDVAKAQERFVEARRKILADGGGLVSIYYHPCEFVHKQFWDGANFTKGANPHRERWVKPEVKTPEESKTAYDSFFAYMRFIQRFEDVKFITASEAAAMYRDTAADREFSADQIKVIAEKAVKELDFQRHREYALAPSEVLYLLNEFVVGKRPKAVKLMPTPFGPSEAPRAMPAAVSTNASQFARTAEDVADYFRKHGRVPSAVWLGSTAVTPEAYLAALAKVVLATADGSPLPEQIELKPTPLATAKYVQDDNPKLWGWVIFPADFRAPAMMELAKRQAWTIKPAILRP